ncbi:MAG: YdcF family protein [Rhodovibrionaceae bacterium]
MAARRGGTLRSLLFLLGFLGLLLLAGFLWFLASLPQEVEDSARQTDAIVVLTGGSGRVGQGLELLEAGKAKKLFISGVYYAVDVNELLRVAERSPEDLSCCIALGYEAGNTRGNAEETAAWIGKQGYSSLRLVTSAYHMPRSLLQFRRLLPGVEIVPHPVFPEDHVPGERWRLPASVSLLLQEYGKYLLTAAEAILTNPEAQAPRAASGAGS